MSTHSRHKRSSVAAMAAERIVQASAQLFNKELEHFKSSQVSLYRKETAAFPPSARIRTLSPSPHPLNRPSPNSDLLLHLGILQIDNLTVLRMAEGVRNIYSTCASHIESNEKFSICNIV